MIGHVVISEVRATSFSQQLLEGGRPEREHSEAPPPIPAGGPADGPYVIPGPYLPGQPIFVVPASPVVAPAGCRVHWYCSSPHASYCRLVVTCSSSRAD